MTPEPSSHGPGPFPLPSRHDARSRGEVARRRPDRYCYVLDADEELASGLDLRTRLIARPSATARVQEVSAGEFDLVPLLAQLRGGLGLLIVDGVIALDVQVGDRAVSELVGAGDLLTQWSGDEEVLLLASETSSRVLVRARMAILDFDFAERIRPWPQILYALLRRTARRTMDLNVHRAATCHPRAEVRIALLLWHLAERWGTVGPNGVLVPLPLTHRLIGQLVGAERPSVSHALSRLANADLVTREPNGLVLHGSVAHHIACLLDRGDTSQSTPLSRSH